MADKTDGAPPAGGGSGKKPDTAEIIQLARRIHERAEKTDASLAESDKKVDALAAAVVQSRTETAELRRILLATDAVGASHERRADSIGGKIANALAAIGAVVVIAVVLVAAYGFNRPFGGAPVDTGTFATKGEVQAANAGIGTRIAAVEAKLGEKPDAAYVEKTVGDSVLPLADGAKAIAADVAKVKQDLAEMLEQTDHLRAQAAGLSTRMKGYEEAVVELNKGAKPASDTGGAREVPVPPRRVAPQTQTHPASVNDVTDDDSDVAGGPADQPRVEPAMYRGLGYDRGARRGHCIPPGPRPRPSAVAVVGIPGKNPSCRGWWWPTSPNSRMPPGMRAVGEY